ncbi:hypothetical protein CONLIGDRAFT_637716 [Coniochaeta ligniaria NRRL 30616]|uniref:Uncharacterized protein n=1 Tax=Coniochaeta ligniaria NRRL 30616 TaxID=1408157 RepID=A0A1J7IQ74_9PEZI|nr:hypothetical protein CONLIGDRAFT_637716 [Coniochaeta ligniaria NRRL 30616]
MSLLIAFQLLSTFLLAIGAYRRGYDDGIRAGGAMRLPIWIHCATCLAVWLAPLIIHSIIVYRRGYNHGLAAHVTGSPTFCLSCEFCVLHGGHRPPPALTSTSTSNVYVYRDAVEVPNNDGGPVKVVSDAQDGWGSLIKVQDADQDEWIRPADNAQDDAQDGWGNPVVNAQGDGQKGWYGSAKVTNNDQDGVGGPVKMPNDNQGGWGSPAENALAAVPPVKDMRREDPFPAANTRKHDLGWWPVPNGVAVHGVSSLVPARSKKGEAPFATQRTDRQLGDREHAGNGVEETVWVGDEGVSGFW